MSIQAQSADGKIHQFPDGTPDAVVDRAMRSYAQDTKPAAPAPKPASRSFMDDLGGAATTLQRAIPGVSEAAALVGSRVNVAADFLTGRSSIDPNDFGGSLAKLNAAAWKKNRDIQQRDVDGFMAAHPNLANLSTGLGYAAQALPALATGGANVLPQVSKAVVSAAPGIRAGLARLAGRTIKAAPRNAVLGGAYGVVNGASLPGDASERIRAAGDAVLPSMAAGVVIPGLIDGAVSVGRHVEPLARRIAAAGKSRVTGIPTGALSGPEVRAAEALQSAIARDVEAGHVIDPTKPLRLAGGENVAALYDVLAKSPGSGRTLMMKAIQDHADATGVAIRADIGKSLGGKGDYFKTQKTLETARSRDAKPAFDAAYAEPVGTDNFDRVLDPILKRLPKGVMAKARDLQRMAGRNPDEAGMAMVDSFDGTPIKQSTSTPEKVSARDLKSLQRGSKVGFGQGRSMLSFLNRLGGLKDKGGELKGLDLQYWHKGKPGHRNMIQDETGLSLEDAAMRAYDAGYFPDAKVRGADADYHPVSPEDFLAAIRDETFGKPRYARAPDPKAIERLGRLDELGGRLKDTPAKLDSLDKESAGQALADHADELARLEAHLDGPDLPMSPNVQARTVNPTLKTLHYVKMGLDDALNKYRDKTTKILDLTTNDAQKIDAVRADLVKSMRAMNPNYEKGMALWGDDSANLDALGLGRSVFSSEFTMQSESLGRLHADMSQQSRAEFRKGVGEAILAETRRPGGDIAAVRRLMGDKSAEFRDRIKLAFGDEASFNRFVETMAERAKDAGRDTRYKGGSPTYSLQAARADLEREGSDVVGAMGDMVDFNPLRAAARAARAGLRLLPKGTPKSAILDPTSNAALGRSNNDNAEVARLLDGLRARRRVAAAPQSQRRLMAPAGAVGGAMAGRDQ